jgi:hypothetical protein
VSNTQGPETHSTDAVADFACFDLLPPEWRQKVRDAAMNLDSLSCLLAYQSPFLLDREAWLEQYLDLAASTYREATQRALRR